MTLAGSKAAGIARWAWQDPQARAVQALSAVHELATQAASRDELAEIQDAGTMLSKLAGTLHPEPALTAPADLITYQLAAPDLISVQMAGSEGIIGQVLDLAGWHDAWRTERRGSHGEWSGGGVGGADRAVMARITRQNRVEADRKSRLQAAEQALAEQQKTQAMDVSSPIGPPSSVNKAAGIAAQARAALPTYVNPASDAIHKKLAEQAAAAADKAAAAQGRADAAMTAGEKALAAAQTKADEAIAKLQAQQKVDEAAQAAKDAAQEAHQAKVRLALHIASISIGGIIAGLVTAMSAGLSLPIAAAIGAGAGISGNVIQELIDWAKKL